MHENDIPRLIAEYLRGSMTKEDEAALMELIRKHGFDAGEMAELAELFGRIDDFPVPEPGAEMRVRFHEMLEQYMEETETAEKPHGKILNWIQNLLPVRLAYPLALGIILIGIGWAGGVFFSRGVDDGEQLNLLHTQIMEMRELMTLTLLEQSSASERIKGVNLTGTFTHADDKIVGALLLCLDNDPNVNVRINAIEALYRFAADPKVRQGLIQAIGRQDSPLVQVALADVMIALEEKSAIGQFHKLLERADLDYAVKERIEKTIKMLM